MKKQGTMEADEEELDEDQYSNDGFEQASPRNSDHSQEITSAKKNNRVSSSQNAEVTKLPANPGAAATAVSPVQSKTGVIGNLEYGMRSKSPAIKIKGDSSQNVPKPRSKPNFDLQDVQEGGKMRSQAKKSLASSQTVKEANQVRRKSGGAPREYSRGSKNQPSQNNEVSEHGRDLTFQRSTPPILQQATILKNFTRNSPKNKSNGSTLPQVMTHNSMKEKYQTSTFSESRYSNNEITNIILPHKLTGKRQIKNTNETLNTSLSHLETIENQNIKAKVPQQDSLQQAADKQNYPVTIPHKLPHQKQYGLKKQNFIKAPYQLSMKGASAVVYEEIGVKNQPQSTKNSEAEIPHIFVHKAKNSVSNSNSNTANTHNGESPKNQLSAKDQKKEKYSLVGRPYLTKSKLPFYDSRGVYQGVKSGGGTTNQGNNKKQNEKLQQYETAYQQVQIVTQHQNVAKKTRAISSTQYQDQSQKIDNNDVQHQRINGPNIEIVNSPRGAVKQFATGPIKTEFITNTRQIIAGSTELGQPEQEYQIIDNMRPSKRGQSDHSGASRGGAVRPPSLSNFRINKDTLRQSVEIVNGPSDMQKTVRQSQREFQSGYKIVQEVPFVESVQENFKTVNKQQRSLNKLLASSGLSKTGFPNIDCSQSSMNSQTQLQIGKHIDKIQSLQANVDQLKEELRIKDRLVSKLLDGENTGDSASTIQKQLKLGNNQMLTPADKPNMVLKLKSELDLAYKILSQRDIEINQMKRQAKWQAFNQCNEERILYMNECMKFQNLLKIYGGSQIRKQFKGVKITQTSSGGQDLQHRGSDTNIGITNKPRARSPTANDDLQLALPKILEVSQGKKPLTSFQPSGAMNLSTGFQLQETELENASQLEDLKKRIQKLEVMNEKLLEDKVEMDEEITQQSEFVSQLKREQLSLEKSLIEKANLVKSFQDLNDDLKSEGDKLKTLNGQLLVQIENLKKDNAKALQSNAVSPKRNSINSEQLAEINKLRDEIENLKSGHSRICAEQLQEIDELKTDVQTLKSDHSRFSAEQLLETERLMAQIETMKLEHASLSALALKSVSEPAQSNELQIQHHESVINEQSDLMKHLEQELENVKASERQCTSRLDSAQNHIQDLNEKITLLEMQLQDEKSGLLEVKSQLDSKKEENVVLIAELEELKQRLEKALQTPASLPAKNVNDLEFQNAELEEKVEELEKKVKDLTMELEKAQSGKTVFENLQDRTNFANLISTQGNLVEQLESERRRTAELQQKIERSEQAANESSLVNLTLEMDEVEQGQLEPGETLGQVQNEIKSAIESVDQLRLGLLRVKERKLLVQEIKYLEEQLIKKNTLINTTLNSQELLTENQAKQSKEITKLHEELEEAKKLVQEKGAELESTMADSENANFRIKELTENCSRLEADLAQLEKKNEKTEIGLHEIVRTTIQEKFLVYKITNQSILKMMLSEQPERVLNDQFMLPLKTQEVIDSSPAGLFSMVDVHKLVDISMIELEIGFRKMKDKLEEMNMDYKRLIFELESVECTPEDEENKDPEEIRRDMADESLKAIPLMKEEFIYKVSSLVIKDQLLAEKIALGCQQVARSVCFVHYWAFNSLWVTFNCKESTGKPKIGMKTLLEQAAQEKEKNAAIIAELERQKQEEAERAKTQLQQAQEEARRREQEMADFVRNKQQEMAEEVRLKELLLIDEAKKREEELVEAARQAQIQLTEEAKKREHELSQKQVQFAEEAKRREQQLEEAARQKEMLLGEQARRRDAELAEAARIRLEREQEIHKLQNLPADGENGDREGFSLGVYRYIKRNKDLGVIVDIANASLFSIRNQCSVFIMDGRRLSDGRRQGLGTNQDSEEEPPFISLSSARDIFGRPVLDLSGTSHEEEVIQQKDFYEEALRGMGLKKYIDIQEEHAKLDDCLYQIGALVTDSNSLSQAKFIRLEVLISAMRIHKYEYAGLNLATKLQGVDFRKLNAKSMRILNRLTRVVAQYQDKYQQKAAEGVKISIQQIVAAIFKGHVEFKTIPKESQPANSGAEDRSGLSEGQMKMALLSKDKFYETLAKLKIKAGPKDIPNLTKFLCLEDQSPDQLQVKKLVVVIEEFLRNHYLKSFGYTKRKFEDRGRITNQIDEDEEEYYYEEEQQTASTTAPAVNPYKQTYRANLPPAPATVQEEYEYYDEEEPSQQQSKALSVIGRHQEKSYTASKIVDSKGKNDLKLEKNEENDLYGKDDSSHVKMSQQTQQQMISKQEYGFVNPSTIRNSKFNNSLDNSIVEPNRFVTSQQDNYKQQIDSPLLKKGATSSMVKVPSGNLSGNFDARALAQNFGQGSDGYRGEPEGASKYQASNFKIEDLDDDEW